MDLKTIKRVVLGASIAILLMIGWFSFTVTIDQGHVGVVYSRSNGVENQTLPQGLHLVYPWKRVTEYPVSTETVSNVENVSTKDGKPLSVKVTYEYKNDVTKLPSVYNKFRGQKPEAIESSWLKARLNEATLSVTSQYTVLEVFQKHEEIRVAIQEAFKKDVAEHGFIVEKVNFGTPKPDKATKKAIQEVVNAQQKLEGLKIQKEQASVQAEKLKIESTGKAEAKIEEANGEAEAIKIKAEAQAKANKEIKSSLTDGVIEYEKINKWDGKNSSTVLGGQGVNVNVK